MNAPRVPLKLLKNFHVTPSTCVAWLYTSAYLKGVINKIFTELVEKDPKPEKMVALLPLNSWEEIVAPPWGSERNLIDLGKFTPKQLRDITVAGAGGADLLAAMTSLYTAPNKLSLPIIDLPDAFFDFQRSQIVFAPIIPKRARCWFGRVPLVTSEEVAQYTETAQDALRCALEECASLVGLSYSMASVPVPGETAEAQKLREARATAWNVELRQRYFRRVIDWVHEADPEIKAALFRTITLAGDKDSKVSRKSEALKSFELLKLPKRQLVLTDTVHYGLGSLKKVGKAIGGGLEKVELEDGVIEDMGEYSRSNFLEFAKYAVQDSATTAECVSWVSNAYNAELGVEKVLTRTASYTAEYFKRVMQEIYSEDRLRESGFAHEANFKKFYGWNKTIPIVRHHKRAVSELTPFLERVEHKDRRFEPATWKPSLQLAQFSRCYAGGWNSCFEVGARGPCTYWDQTSAYPTALSFKRFDYNYSVPLVFYGSQAEKVIKDMWPDGGFQEALVELSWVFKETIVRKGKTYKVEPGFEFQIPELQVAQYLTPEGADTNLHPRRGSGCVPWPEYYAARSMGLLDESRTVIHSIETYPQLSGPSLLAQKVSEVLELRGRPKKKALYKALLAFLSGKFGQGVRSILKPAAIGMTQEKANIGPLTNFSLAAYCTGVCRAVNMELLNNGNRCYAITTDGYITPVMDQLTLGPLGLALDAHLQTIENAAKGEPYRFFGKSFIAERSLFLKTRGYVLEGEDGDGQPGVMVKRMGVQCHAEFKKGMEYDPQAIEFLTTLQNGAFIKKSWMPFQRLKEGGRNLPPSRVESLARCDHSFDLKRIPVGPFADSVFEYGGVEFHHPSFTTRPLFTSNEYVIARKQAEKLMTVEDYERVFLDNPLLKTE